MQTALLLALEAATCMSVRAISADVRMMRKLRKLKLALKAQVLPLLSDKVNRKASSLHK
jgi:hypothetical protein